MILLVEVCDASISYDREVKLPLYARAGISDVWLIDLEAQQVEVYRGPAAGGFADKTRVSPEKPLTVPGLPGLVIGDR